MRNAIVVLLGALTLLACSKEKPADNANVTTTTRGATNEAPPATAEEVRTILIEKRPGSTDLINALVITNEGGIITLRGKVEDEPTHADLVSRVKAMPNVRGVRDELQVSPKSATAQVDKYGTTTTTGAPVGQEQHEKGTMSKSDAVRKNMEKARPKAESIIHALTITDDGQVVIVSGVVPDEATHQALAKAAKETPGVKGLQDEMKVQKKP